MKVMMESSNGETYFIDKAVECYIEEGYWKVITAKQMCYYKVNHILNVWIDK